VEETAHSVGTGIRDEHAALMEGCPTSIAVFLNGSRDELILAISTDPPRAAPITEDFLFYITEECRGVEVNCSLRGPLP
jgi:hypothetical protein